MATTPYPFVSGTVLTATKLNSTFNIATTTKTASHTLIAADAGTRIYMNSSSSTSITANTSIFAASDVIEIFNIGSGICTVATGTATVSSAGPLAIPQFGSGRLTFTAAGACIYTPSAVTASAGALTFITSGTVTAATTTDITNVFSSTFDNYFVIIQDAVSSVDGQRIDYRYGTGTADTASTYTNGESSTGIIYSSTDTSHRWQQMGTAASNTFGGGTIQIQSPNLALPTNSQSSNSAYRASAALLGIFGISQNMKQTTTQYTSLHFFNPSGGTLTFKFKIYGYANS